jgi:tetratricopeptide (TPR) repeat protein
VRPRLSTTGATAIALAALALVVFGTHLRGEFVWDDFYLVEKNPLVLSAAGWRGLLVTDLWEGAGQSLSRLYHPLPMLTLWMQVWATGLAMVPLRLVNVGIHLGNVWLFYRLLLRGGARPATASAMALLFAVHPLAVEPALWLTGRHDTLAVLLGLAGLHASSPPVAGPPDRRRSAWRYAGLAVTAAGAFASKEPYVVLPALYLAYPLLVARDGVERALRAAAAGAAGVALVFAIRAHLGIPSVGGLPGVPIAEHLRTYGTLAGVYGGYSLALTTGPSTRSYAGWPLGAAIASTAAVAGVGLAALWRWRAGSRTGGRVAFGTAWFAIALSPHVVSLPTLGVLGNRYGYFPLLGILYAAAALLDELVSHVSPRLERLVVAASFAPILVAAALASEATSLWQSDISLFGADYAENPDDPQTLYFLGCAIERRAGCEKAVPFFQKAAALAPSMERAQQNLAACLVDLGRGAEAVAPAEAAARARPNADNLFNLALALQGAGRIEEATQAAEQGARLAPGYTRFPELLERLRSGRQTGDGVGR